MHEDPSLRNLAPRAEALAARHEVEDFTLGGIKGFVVFLSLMLIVTFIVVWIVARVLLHYGASEDGPVSPFAGVNHPLPSEPQIQPSRNHNTLDWMDLKGLRDEENQKLTEYAWIGTDKQKARIPIERAMDMVLDQGLPTRQGSSGSPAALPNQGGAGGLMVAPSNPLTLPPGNVRWGTDTQQNNERNGYGQ